MEVGGQLHAPATLRPGKEPRFPLAAPPRPGLDAMAKKKKKPATAGKRTAVIHSKA
jgi:hypothetical protein